MRLFLIKADVHQMIWALVTFLTLIPSVQASPRLLLYTLGSSSQIQAKNYNTITFAPGPVQLGLGAGIEFNFGKGLALEGNLLYFSRGVRATAGTTTRIMSATMLEIPVFVKYNFFQYFSIGAGLYGAYGVRDVNYTDTSGKPLPSSPYVNENLSQYDLGLAFSGEMKYPLTRRISMTFQARYQMGLTNIGLVVPANSNLSYSDWMGVIGIRINSLLGRPKRIKYLN